VVAIIVIREGRAPQIRRLRAEYRRVGFWRLFDILAFRLYYRIFLAAGDRAWERSQLKRLTASMRATPAEFPTLMTPNPNDARVTDFLRRAAPDLMVARCKWLLKRSVYEIPSFGTFVLHPGICPQYRNAHGCFWALACNDPANVGLTLLRIDDGIDTGPIYEFFRYRFDAATESHIRIQERTVLENLDGIRSKQPGAHSHSPSQRTGHATGVSHGFLRSCGGDGLLASLLHDADLTHIPRRAPRR
jgi:hypothetical protein